MAAKLKIEATIADLTGSAVIARLPPASSPRRFINWLVGLLTAFVSGAHRARLRVSVDDSLGVAASNTITCVQASATAGDKLVITAPDGKVFRFTAVSGTPVPASGEYAIITSNTAVANSLRAAMAAVPGFVSYWTPSGTATLILTARVAGATGNLARSGKEVTVAGAFTGTGLFTGGIDPGALQSVTLALGGALTADDTVTIGNVVLTAKASPSGENQFAATVSAAADGAALAACINAHSKLKGLLVASGTSTVTVQLLEGGRLGHIVAISKSAAQITLTGTFAPSTTDAYASTVVEYNLGAP